MKVLLSLLAAVTAAAAVSGTGDGVTTYTITAPESPKIIRSGHLDMGGESPDGGSIEVNSYYMSIDGRPVIPVLGEFHFSRYPAEQWEDEILKIKAGGVTVIPTYIFWSIHEEREGEFDWSGDRDLRRFVELCAKHDMPVIVRIGPFCHGEIRNGGIPDWIFAKPLDIRTDDPLYLKYVDRLYGEIARQLDGLWYKDGGPIIGCQLENELQHSAAPWGICYPGEAADHTSAVGDAEYAKVGVSVQERRAAAWEAGEQHLRTLKALAQKHGIITPLYTATGWGNAAVIPGETLPVTSAYTFPFWSKPAMSEFCRFKDMHRHPDYEPVRYVPEDYPAFCAEMGVGIQMTYSRRPIVPGAAAEALMVRSLGSGSNGIGYYMYHGGSTPKRGGGTEAFFSDEPMGMPKISYDFQAPLGEFGLEGKMYRNLRILHLFLADFGDILAPMETVLPAGWESITPDNRDDLRWCVRTKDGSGFVFMVNYQDHDSFRHDQEGIRLEIDLGDETLTIPAEGSLTLGKDVSAILPFNLDLSGVPLKYATAQLLARVDDGGTDHYFFFAPEKMAAEYCFDDCVVRIDEPGFGSTFTRGGVRITTLTRRQAENAAKFDGKLLISEATAIEPAPGRIELLSLGDNSAEYVLYPSSAGFEAQTAEVEPVEPEFELNTVNSRRFTVHFTGEPSEDVAEYFLSLDYTGDVAMAFLGGGLVHDHFWTGEPWLIGLNRLRDGMQDEDLVFYLRPLRRNAPFLGDIPEESLPDFEAAGGGVVKVSGVDVIPQYRIPVRVL